MRFPKKLTSILLVLCLVVSVAAIAIVPAAAEETVETYAMDTVRGGSILHCFDWSYNNIKANLADIAKAGYTAVQTSPVQSPKDYNAGWTDASGQWWKLYQPLGFSVSNGNTWLGTKAELTSLCAEADKYNIKVIVDIVANHLANNGTDGGTYSYLNSGVDTDLKNANYYHTNNTRTSDDSRYTITQYHLGMPDLNTGNSYVQQRALGLLEECLDCGVDGFRFDAAKHIELPTDNSSCASQFWPTVINGATAYAAQKGYAAPFYYGEILGGAGTDISNYTTYMAVTDNYTGDLALDKAYWKYAPDLANGTYHKGASAADSVLWVESHDTYMGESGSAWTKNTKDVTSDVLDKAWAIVGARADSTALFFARPNATMGLASADTNWKSTAVAEVNKFKNHFAGTGEYLASSGNTVAYIERGTKGVVISKLDGGGAVSITAHQMEDGTYTDQVTGNSFTVANGTISGTVGDTGVAVVYNPAESVLDYITADTLYLNPSADGWKQGNERYAMYLFNSAAEDTAWVSMSDSDNDGIYSAGVPSGNWTNVIFCRMNGSTTENSWDSKWHQTINLYPEGNYNLFTVTGQQYDQSGNYVGDWSVFEGTQPTTAQPTTVQPTTVQPTTSAPASDTITVYAYNTNNWSEMNVYYWGSSSTNPDWPGDPMENGTTVFSATIPKDVTGIIFNNNTDQTVDIKSGIADNMQWYITNETDNSGHYSVVNGPTYYLVGGMTNWGRDNSYQLSLAPAADGKVQYQLNNVALSANAEIKINDSKNNWYPDYNGNYTVPADGTYTVYFRPNADGDSDWHYNYFKLESTTSTYTVTWKNDDGTILKTDTVAEGETPAYSGDTPAKAATFDNTYTFSGWTPAPAPAAGDVTYTASYTAAEVPKYNIGLTNAIGWDTVYVYYWLGSQNNNWPGTALTVSGTDNFQMTAQIPSNVEGVIFNNGDDKQTGDITANIKNGAHWAVSLHNNAVTVNEVPSYYLVGTMNHWDKNNAPVFIPVKNDRGLEEYKLSEVVLSKDDQMKVCDSNDHWFPSDSNANYTVGSAGTYDVYFRPHGDGNQDWHKGYFYLANVSKYMVSWVDGDGHLLKTDTVSYGETPQYTGDVPTKTADAQYSYIFNNTWEPAVTAATADATYHAQFDATVNTYRVIWRNYDGSLLAADQVPFGETPAYSGSTPEKPYDEQYHYTFRGWDTPVQPVADHQSYTAVFDIFPHAYVSPSQTDWNLDEHKVEVTYICSDCGHEERHTVYFSDYDFEATTPPTCTQPGTGHYRVTDNFNYNMIPLLSDDIEIPATGHHYSNPVWNWSEDFASASVDFTCIDCSEVITKIATVETINYWAPTCLSEGSAAYRATVTLDGIVYDDTRYQTIPATGHQWNEEPQWMLSDDKTFATAVFECEVCHTTEAWNTYEVRVEYYPDRTEYIAELRRFEQTYTHTFTEPPVTFTVHWYNADGMEIGTSEVTYGAMPVYFGETPVMEPDEWNHYAFSGWTPELSPVYGDWNYRADFSSLPHTYHPTGNAVWDIANHTVTVSYICDDCGYTTNRVLYFDDTQFVVDTPASCTTAGSGHYAVTDHYNGTPVQLVSDAVAIPATGHAWLPPVCVWSEDYSSATVTFTCTQCGESVVLTDDSIEVTYNGDNAIYRASVMLDGQAYFFDHSETRQYFTGHTLTLKGDIGVNYFIALTDEEFNTGNVAVQFTYNVEGNIKTFTVSKDAIKKVGENLYKATCYVAAAEMTYDITADLFLNEMLKASNVYSVKEYADYIIAHADDNAAYAKAAPLVLAMLDYGTRAQVVFERNTDKPANDGTYKVTYDVKADDIEVPVSDMKANLDTYGLTYVGSTVIYLSETTLRHYYRVTDEDAFNNYRDSITLDGAPAAFGERNGMVYVEFTNISAKDLGKAHTFTVGDDSYNYSALAYAKKVIEKGTNPDEVELAKAMVRYYQAAETFFGA